jgi:hypothetical protein
VQDAAVKGALEAVLGAVLPRLVHDPAHTAAGAGKGS